MDKTAINIQVLVDPNFVEVMERNWTDDEVIERMQSFYNENPEFQKTPEIPILDSIDEVEVREAISLRDKLESTVDSAGYRANYLACCSNPHAKELHAVEEVVVYYAVHLVSDDDDVLQAVRLIIEFSTQLYGTLPYELSWPTIKHLVQVHGKAKKL